MALIRMIESKALQTAKLKVEKYTQQQKVQQEQQRLQEINNKLKSIQQRRSR